MKKSVALLCAALVLGSPLASFAQPGPGPDYSQGNGPNNGQNRQDNHGPQQQQRQQPQQQPQRAPQGHYDQHAHSGQSNAHAYRNPDFHPQAGMPVPHRDWRRGVVVEPNYRGDRYWVTDWHARHLYAPPRDHRWLYVNGDYILVAIASGVIVNILSGY
ncbi:RcnB family protein [Pseudomonas nitroreducens]|uniref:RcnB family protein n=1 Tax=Pseudomonas nitroreducens TaxID=46680 RepID=UPI00209ED956|nr:RcnB family protein [Pseudomonas nitroreducens]MCP1622845.1 Ni/Co efflux regulator RcnB [Pseudomonas nitroreducens]